MFPGSKVSNDNGLWPCIGIAALNVNNSSSGFGRKPLVMPEPKAQNEFAGNGLQGSVPSSPESDCEEIVDYSPVCAALEMDTREIIDIFLKSFTGLPHSKSGKKQILSTMKRVVDSLVVKHELAYKGMIARLNLEEKGEDVSFVKTVATELFSDGITNWGRIASLLTFGAIVCKHQNDRGLSKCVSLVGEEISSYLLTDQRHWLLKNKAWDGFEEFFHVPDTEGAVRNALMAIGSFATFGAALAYLIRPSVGSNEDYGNDTHRASPDPPAHCGSTCCGYLSQAVKLSGIQESGDEEYKGDLSETEDEVDSDFDIDEGDEPDSEQEEDGPRRKSRVVTKAYKEPVKVVRQKPKQRKLAELPRRTVKTKINKYNPPELQEDINKSETFALYLHMHM
uniref:MCL1 apoptosis regulator, BCL2 family member b n=2 Tax=Cyprinus carpio TaxID=7962 RepID=A0A8C2A7T6_CYPCA